MDLHNEFENSKLFHRSRIDRRAADALVGLAAGITADGVVNTGEAIFLKRWLESNLVHLNDPVINLLYSRLASMLQDDALDPDEALELLNSCVVFLAWILITRRLAGLLSLRQRICPSIHRRLIWYGMAGCLSLRALWPLGRGKIARH
ncbi:hypothetical protein PHLH5_02820 [Pseudomonas sp. Cab53]|uniref:hypothetical protein n=1 Tax=Pseudomonas sp. Cab53 TaxID=2678258 RepID=UPI001BEDAAE0|nr:hypothetical protein [Pseudomonas sp. Cab53]BBP62741.1 hypothetical protein PHLH5_02820 [Pseudomonas sp. Cab53]